MSVKCSVKCREKREKRRKKKRECTSNLSRGKKLPQLKISIKVHNNQKAARRATGQWVTGELHGRQCLGWWAWCAPCVNTVLGRWSCSWLPLPCQNDCLTSITRCLPVSPVLAGAPDVCAIFYQLPLSLLLLLHVVFHRQQHWHNTNNSSNNMASYFCAIFAAIYAHSRAARANQKG